MIRKTIDIRQEEIKNETFASGYERDGERGGRA